MSKLRVLSLFSGIGAFEKALTNLNIPFDLVGFSEIDKYAIKSYCAIHNVDIGKNLGDITKINLNTVGDFDILVGGSPCQNISIMRKTSVEGRNPEGLSGSESRLFFDYVNVLNKVVKLSGMDCWCVVYNNHVEDIEEGVVITLEEAIPDILEGVLNSFYNLGIFLKFFLNFLFYIDYSFILWYYS